VISAAANASGCDNPDEIAAQLTVPDRGPRLSQLIARDPTCEGIDRTARTQGDKVGCGSGCVFDE